MHYFQGSREHSADRFFRCVFFLGALRVKIFFQIYHQIRAYFGRDNEISFG